MSNVYDFKQLSDRDFEDLTRDLLQAEWAIRLEPFGSGRDEGIDLRHAPSPDKAVIVQCKHYAGSGFPKLLWDLKNRETAKVKRLQPARYVLVTSVPLTPENKRRIITLFEPHLIGPSDVFGCGDLNNLLARHPQVEQATFKLWLTSRATLDRVLHSAERCQTDFELRRIQSKLRLYVQNSCYSRAMRFLRRSRVVIISGVPGVGKSTLAEVLLYSHLEKGYAPVVIQSSVNEGRKLFNPAAKQVFYFDDFLGQSFLGERREFLSRNEDVSLLRFIEMISASSNSRLIMTTRGHILRGACEVSERFDHSLIRDLQCLVELEDYSMEQKSRILENHVHFSDLPRSYRDHLRNPDLQRKVLTHQHFNPRLIEWITSYARVKDATVHYPQLVLSILRSPERIWQHAFEAQIGNASRSLIVALASLGNAVDLRTLGDAWEALHRYRAKKYGFSWAPDDWRVALRELEQAFIRVTGGHVSLLNPSVAEFVRRLISHCHDYAVDVVASARYFSQVGTMWDFANAPDGVALSAYFYRQPEELLASFSRTLHLPVEPGQSTNEGTHLTFCDDPWGKRLDILMSIASTLGAERLWEHAHVLAGRMMQEWQLEGEYVRQLVDLLWNMEHLPWDVTPLRRLLKKELFERLADVGLVEDFALVRDYAIYGARGWSDEDGSALEGQFNCYVSGESFDHEYRSCGSLRDLWALWDSISRAPAITEETALGKIAELKKELRSHESLSIAWDPSLVPRTVCFATVLSTSLL